MEGRNSAVSLGFLGAQVTDYVGLLHIQAELTAKGHHDRVEVHSPGCITVVAEHFQKLSTPTAQIQHWPAVAARHLAQVGHVDRLPSLDIIPSAAVDVLEFDVLGGINRFQVGSDSVDLMLRHRLREALARFFQQQSEPSLHIQCTQLMGVESGERFLLLLVELGKHGGGALLRLTGGGGEGLHFGSYPPYVPS